MNYGVGIRVYRHDADINTTTATVHGYNNNIIVYYAIVFLKKLLNTTGLL